MLTHEETMLLIEQAQNGDESAREKLLIENTPLVKSILKRYIGKHVEYDDLFQISSIGLLKAINNFSMSYNVKFSTYAVPMILGEIKRYMRDDGYIKVSRSVKSLSNKMLRYIEDERQKGNEVTVDELSRKFEIDSAEVVYVLDSAKMPISLYEQNADDNGKECGLIERMPTDDDKKLVEKVILRDMLSKLSPREQKVIVLRYFRDMTQTEIAEKLGVSQVQVSRLENRILEKLRILYEI